jgi:hypothetical protein
MPAATTQDSLNTLTRPILSYPVLTMKEACATHSGFVSHAVTHAVSRPQWSCHKANEDSSGSE